MKGIVSCLAVLLVVLLVVLLGGLIFSSAPANAGILDWRVNSWVEASLYPPHNEFDPNPGVEFEDRVTARYSLEVFVELRPEDFPRLILFANPHVFFGDSRPQTDYNWRATAIVANGKYGIGYQLFKKPDIQVRIAHGEWIGLGDGYKGEKLLWNAVQVRWTFSAGKGK